MSGRKRYIYLLGRTRKNLYRYPHPFFLIMSISEFVIELADEEEASTS